MANTKIPAFFKPIAAPDSSERLIIPMTFAAYMKGRLPRRAFLRNPYGDIWQMEIARNESTDEYTFEGGWPEFAEQNKLEYQDMLIFQYDGRELFDFKIYGKSNAEKEYMRFLTVKSEAEEMEQKQPQEMELQLVQVEEMEPETEAGTELEPAEREYMTFQSVKLEPQEVEQQQPREMELELAQPEEMEPEPEAEAEAEPDLEPAEKEIMRFPSVKSEPQEVEQQQPWEMELQLALWEEMEPEPEPEPEAEAEPDLEPAEKEIMRFPSVKLEPQEVEQQQPQGWELELVEPREMEPELELEVQPEPEPEAEEELEYSSNEMEDHDEADSDFLLEAEEESSSRNKKIRGKRAPPIKEADEVALFESGDIPRPTNPFFVSQRRSDRNELYVPTDVLRDFNIKLPKDLSIFDERNRKWVAKVHTWKDGRIWLSKGWKHFCKWNNVKPIDMCVCEFIPATDDHGIYLKVRVIREGALRRPPRS